MKSNTKLVLLCTTLLLNIISQTYSATAFMKKANLEGNHHKIKHSKRNKAKLKISKKQIKN